ncbi:MAG: AI-2E family transporter [Desulfatitalea sp.]
MGDLNTRNPILWFFLACFIGTAFILGWLLLPFLSILVLGAVVSSICLPLYRAIRKHPKIRGSIAAFTTCFLLFLVLFVPTVFFVGSLAQQALELYQMAKGAVLNDQINTLLHDTRILDRANALLANFNYSLTGDEIKNAVSGIVKFVGLFLYEQARDVASNTLAFLVNFFLMLLVVYFLLLDGERLIAYISDLSPLPNDQEHTLIVKFKEMAGAILIVNGLVAIIQGGLGGILFWVFGIQSAFLLGVVMGILAFIPIIGIGSLLVPMSAYLFLKGNVGLSIFFLVFYVVAAGAEYVLKPHFVGQQVEMHPLLVFFAILGGLKLFGILGIIYGPLVVTAFLTLAEIYRANYQQVVESRPAQDPP